MWIVLHPEFLLEKEPLLNGCVWRTETTDPSSRCISPRGWDCCHQTQACIGGAHVCVCGHGVRNADGCWFQCKPLPTYDDQQRQLATGLRAFADNDRRRFVSDATLAFPYGARSQMGAAMRRPGVEGFGEQAQIIRHTRFEEPPDWMNRLHTSPLG